jgi:hypothetical protein
MKRNGNEQKNKNSIFENHIVENLKNIIILMTIQIHSSILKRVQIIIEMLRFIMNKEIKL